MHRLISANVMPVAIAAVIAIIGLVAYAWWRSARGRRQRRQLMAAPFPEHWKTILEENFPLYAQMPEEVRQRLHPYINVFVHEKNFEACGELEQVTEEMRVTIAAQACLLLLSGRHGVYERLQTVLLYPDIFSRDGGMDEDGIEGGEQQLLGESWDTGSVVLSWFHSLRGPEVEEDGQNVVIHEFAHQLDQIDSTADGAPTLASAEAYREWAETFSDAYQRHQKRLSGRRKVVIDPYGGTNPAEFFAVATETFFEKPKQLHKRYPDVYQQLKHFYAVDPLGW